MKQDSIEQVKQAVQQWRKKKGHRRERAPEAVRKRVIALCDQVGRPRVAQELRMSSSVLWRWREELGQKKERKTGKRIKPKPADSTPSHPVQFIEINPAPAARQTSSGLTISLVRVDGAQVKIDGFSDSGEIWRFAHQFLAGSAGL
jgi:hypothetical protein